jgi:HSP20 family protein
LEGEIMARGKKNDQPMKTKTKTKTKRAAAAEPLATGDGNLVSWLPAPGEFVNRLREEVDHLFDEFGIDKLAGSLPNLAPESWETWTPQVEAFERAGQFVIRADLPGVTRDDITVELSDSSITIAGQRKQEHEENRQGYYRSERRYGHFLRRIPLPDGAKADTAKSTFRNGVLEITMAAPAVKAETKARQTRKLVIEDESVSARAAAR